MKSGRNPPFSRYPRTTVIEMSSKRHEVQVYPRAGDYARALPGLAETCPAAGEVRCDVRLRVLRNVPERDMV
jgi:hypothetical protein